MSLLIALPQLSPEDRRVPIRPAEFLATVYGTSAEHWCEAIFDWFRICNWQTYQLSLPLAYPEHSKEPRLAMHGNPWQAFYTHLTALDAPEVISEWGRIDVSLLVRRAQTEGGHVQVGPVLRPSRLIEQVPLGGDAHSERVRLRVMLMSLESLINGRDPAAVDWVYLYAVQLLNLYRIEGVQHA